MEYEESDQGGKMVTWHVDENTGVPKKVVLAEALYNCRSLSSLSFVIFKARSTGIDVNKDITSNETLTSSTAI